MTDTALQRGQCWGGTGGHRQQVPKGGTRVEGDTEDRHWLALLFISRGGCCTLSPHPSRLPFKWSGKRFSFVV